ncbi:acid protease [Dothidotthia symphoricarpi CBS 119687]|uniref:Acid protease n=1 Tax=Dothidotthia symphoricarpi CBS 119687 TaxID=1392245 RepID=A0A6A6A0M0_9PLEO|nr:acid protease [Dothidotthia symphoricarpi CBS 119687]KAF2124248.1 acid protease [Dothidotthia symphoricarpi CBS 119687]
MRPEILLLLLASTSYVSGTILPLGRRQQSYSKPLISTENGIIFGIEVLINNQPFYLIPDTGSSDLWVPVADFQCVEPVSGNEVPQKKCYFGGTYHVPASTEYVANQTFGVQYGTGIAVGKVGFADITLNGITIEHQQIGLVDRTNDTGDGLGSGVLGLGFPPLTSAHPGTELDNSTLLINRAVYDPVFVGMYKKGLVEPWYSFAIERLLENVTSGPGGWLGLGELPPVAHSDDWATKPIEVTKDLPDELTGGEREITLMTLTIDGVTWNSASSNSSITNSTKFQAVVDTGNHMNLLPAAIAEAINGAFNPVGVFDEESGVYVVDCDAKTPELGIILDGHTFWHQRPEDLIYHDASGFCYSSVASTGVGDGLALNFLGDAFLRNVVSVFDFGKEEMRFAARINDNSTSPLSSVGTGVRSSVPTWWFAIFALAMVL